MALIKCTECGRKFSDYAKTCPNCACPTSKILEQIEINNKVNEERKEINKNIKEKKEKVKININVFRIVRIVSLVIITIILVFLIKNYIHVKTYSVSEKQIVKLLEKKGFYVYYFNKDRSKGWNPTVYADNHEYIIRLYINMEDDFIKDEKELIESGCEELNDNNQFGIDKYKEYKCSVVKGNYYVEGIDEDDNYHLIFIRYNDVVNVVYYHDDEDNINKLKDILKEVGYDFSYNNYLVNKIVIGVLLVIDIAIAAVEVGSWKKKKE